MNTFFFTNFADV